MMLNDCNYKENGETAKEEGSEVLGSIYNLKITKATKKLSKFLFLKKQTF